ncbi:ATP-binding protein [Kitasatospora sp. NPDC001132]
MEELDLAHPRGMTRQQLAHLGTLDFIAAKENAIFLGPQGTGKTHIATGLAIRACQAGHRVAFAMTGPQVTTAVQPSVEAGAGRHLSAGRS